MNLPDLPEFVANWSVASHYDGTYKAYVSRKFDLRDNYGRILGPSISGSAHGASTPYEALSIALNKLVLATEERLAEQNANPPKAHPILKAEVDDLMNLLDLS